METNYPKTIEFNRHEIESIEAEIARDEAAMHEMEKSLADKRDKLRKLKRETVRLEIGIREGDTVDVSEAYWYEGHIIDKKQFRVEITFIEALDVNFSGRGLFPVTRVCGFRLTKNGNRSRRYDRDVDMFIYNDETMAKMEAKNIGHSKYKLSVVEK